MLHSHLHHWWSSGARHQPKRAQGPFFYIDSNCMIQITIVQPIYTQSATSSALRWKVGTSAFAAVDYKWGWVVSQLVAVQTELVGRWLKPNARRDWKMLYSASATHSCSCRTDCETWKWHCLKMSLWLWRWWLSLKPNSSTGGILILAVLPDAMQYSFQKCTSIPILELGPLLIWAMFYTAAGGPVSSQ